MSNCLYFYLSESVYKAKQWTYFHFSSNCYFLEQRWSEFWNFDTFTAHLKIDFLSTITEKELWILIGIDLCSLVKKYIYSLKLYPRQYNRKISTVGNYLLVILRSSADKNICVAQSEGHSGPSTVVLTVPEVP